MHATTARDPSLDNASGHKHTDKDKVEMKQNPVWMQWQSSNLPDVPTVVWKLHCLTVQI